MNLLKRYFKRLSIFSAISLCFLSCGCNRENSVTSPFKWTSINEKADSLTQLLDRSLFRNDLRNSEIYFDSLKSVNSLLHNEELALRLDYFKLSIAERNGNKEDFSEQLISSLLQKTDSAQYPYLYNRILFEYGENVAWNVDEYERLNSAVNFFRSKGDAPMTSMALIHLGNLLKNVRDPQGAIGIYKEADSLLTASGFDRQAQYNRMNMATALIITGDTVRATHILEELEKSRIIRQDTGMWMNVLHNLFIDCGKRESLDTLYALQGQHTESLVETFMSNALLNEGNIKESVAHAEKAVSIALEDSNYNDYAVGLYALSDALGAAGDTTAAYRALLEAVELTDEIGMGQERDKIRNVETDRELAIKRLEKELAKSNMLLRIACIGFVLLLLSIVSWLIVSRRISHLKSQSHNERKRSVHLSRKLTATQIAMDETSKVLDDVSRALDEIKSSDTQSPGKSKNIASTIHTHKARTEDRETFIDIFTSTNPEFAKRLKQKNEAFTETDIRIASYIVTGMDNKHIANTLGIRPESVKQARWRLRTKLGLEKGASLEEALRELNEVE